jgi:ubiquinone/menaquinone biosynthesis C-methylase UbiE
VTEYVLSRFAAEDLERERLELLGRFLDPLSTRLFDAIGVTEGWRCLDVGAGGGSSTRLLAQRVGETGSVVATDLDTRLLEPLAGGCVEVWRHDLVVDPLPEAEFDLAHVRFVLMHIPSRFEALRRIVSSVRPGGWLAVMDPDFTDIRVSPATPASERTWSAFLDATVAAGWDPSYGARLYRNLESLELEEIEAEYLVSEGLARDRARLTGLLLERLRTKMHEQGVTDADVDEARRLLEDPATRFRSPVTTLARARRPQGGRPRLPPSASFWRRT